MNIFYNKTILVFTGFILCLCLNTSQAQLVFDFDKIEIKTHKVSDTIYMLEGLGGNIGLLVGVDGAFIIDNQFAELTDKIVAAVRDITDKEIRFLVNTHFHGDHTGGNENFAKMGVLIFAHENVHKVFNEGTIDRRNGAQIPPAPKIAQPVVTFQDQMNLYINGEAIQIIHLAPAHTNGDSLIYFSNSDVLHTGDVYMSTTYPIIDKHNGGRFQGIIDALNRVIEIANTTTVIIPGHGNVSNETEVIENRDMLLDIHDRISKLISEGKSLEQIIVAKPTVAYDEQRISRDERWRPTELKRRDQLIIDVYRKLTEER